MAPNPSVLGKFDGFGLLLMLVTVYFDLVVEIQKVYLRIKWSNSYIKRRGWESKRWFVQNDEKGPSHEIIHSALLNSLTPMEHSKRSCLFWASKTFSRRYSLQALNTFTVYPEPFEPGLIFPLLATNCPPSERVSLQHPYNPNICSASISCTFSSLRDSTFRTIFN